jgi:hypothetical protein
MFEALRAVLVMMLIATVCVVIRIGLPLLLDIPNGREVTVEVLAFALVVTMFLTFMSMIMFMVVEMAQDSVAGNGPVKIPGAVLLGVASGLTFAVMMRPGVPDVSVDNIAIVVSLALWVLIHGTQLSKVSALAYGVSAMVPMLLFSATLGLYGIGIFLGLRLSTWGLRYLVRSTTVGQKAWDGLWNGVFNRQ